MPLFHRYIKYGQRHKTNIVGLRAALRLWAPSQPNQNQELTKAPAVGAPQRGARANADMALRKRCTCRVRLGKGQGVG